MAATKEQIEKMTEEELIDFIAENWTYAKEIYPPGGVKKYLVTHPGPYLGVALSLIDQ